jgi:hypothetical protein
MKRAVYDKQFKMAAVKHAQSVGQSVNEVAKELGISVTGTVPVTPVYLSSSFDPIRRTVPLVIVKKKHSC